MSKERMPVILGYDAVSALGVDFEAQWIRALRGDSGIGPLTRFPIPDDFPVKVAGQAPDIPDGKYDFLRPRKLALWPSPIFKYALLTVHRAIERSGIEITPALAPRTAVTFSSAVGGQDAVLASDRRMTAEGKLPPPFSNANSCINMVGGKISILTGATGPITATITACATGLTSMVVAAMLLAQGKADVAICGAVDFALVAPIVAGFATMGGAYRHKPGLSAEDVRRASRPFSVDRRGFVISEGSGVIILSTRAFAEAHGLAPEIELAGWAMTSDAHHFVAPKLGTMARCISESIQDAGILPADIDAINAHASATPVGDKIEYEAIRSVFGDRSPVITANKSLIGHAMGASSAIESIWAMEGMRRGVVLPTINYRPDPEIPFSNIFSSAHRMEQEFVLKNAFGFGGCNTCAVFRRVA